MLDSIQLKNKLGIDHKYVLLTELPTGYRSYKGIISNIYIRDLMFDEIKSLSSYLSQNLDLNQLVNTYGDIVKITTIDGNQFDLLDLELADFHYLLVATSILTESESKWTATKECSKCPTEITTDFHYSDIEYELITEGIDLPIPLTNTSKFIKPVLVKDQILLSDENISKIKNLLDIKIDDESLTSLITYAISLTYSNISDIADNVKLLNSNPKLIKLVKEINKELVVLIKPFKHVCDECKTVNYFNYDFDSLKGYL